jgi:hypothetical protein
MSPAAAAGWQNGTGGMFGNKASFVSLNSPTSFSRERASVCVWYCDYGVVRLSLSAKSVSHSTVFFSHNKLSITYQPNDQGEAAAPVLSSALDT